mgnify:CR=1 FL=1
MDRKEALLAKLKQVRDREVEILAELFCDTSFISNNNKEEGTGVSKQSGKLHKGTRVRILTRGVNAKRGDTGEILGETKKHYVILLDKSKTTTSREFKNVVEV